jgi:hypothetical protein
MAAPMVAGVAALLKSYFPNMTMLEIKNVILETSRKYPKNTFPLPGEDKMVMLQDISITGGVVDVNAAVKKCLALEKAKKK